MSGWVKNYSTDTLKQIRQSLLAQTQLSPVDSQELAIIEAEITARERSIDKSKFLIELENLMEEAGININALQVWNNDVYNTISLKEAITKLINGDP